MAVYYVTIFILTGLGYALTQNRRPARAVNAYLAFAFFFLTIVASLRYAIGFDYFSYQDIYTTMSGWTFADILRTYWYEPFFFILCKLFTLAGCSFPVFLAFLNLFLLSAAMCFIRFSSSLPWMSVFLYITLQFLAYDMNLVRQSLALSFFLLACPYIMKQKILPYTILMLAGGLFHNSLWFMYPLYFLLPVKMTWKSAGCLSASAVLGYLFFDPLFHLLHPLVPVKYAAYESSYFWNASTFDYIIPAAAYAMLLFLFRSRITDARKRSIYLNSALYYFLISLFLTKHFILERFAIYPYVFSLIAIPDIIVSFADENPLPGRVSKKTSVTFLFLLFGSACFLFAASKGFHNVYPYVSLFDKSISSI